MSETLVLELLRAIRGDLGKVVSRLDAHGRRLAPIELALARLRRDRIERIEDRLELAGPV